MARRAISSIDRILTEDQHALREAVGGFGRAERARLAGMHRPSDAEERLHDPEVYLKLARLGWLGVSLPEANGGGGGSLTDLCIVLEETARRRQGARSTRGRTGRPTTRRHIKALVRRLARENPAGGTAGSTASWPDSA